MLTLAQSNPQLVALLGGQASVTRELERMEQRARLEQLSPADLQASNSRRWADWLHVYRCVLAGAGGVSGGGVHHRSP